MEREGKLLFLHQTKKNGGGYSLVGGAVEEREFAREALVREVKEEAGITVNPHELQLVHVLHRHKLRKNEQYLVLYFKATHFEGIPAPLERKKFKDVIWLPKNQLPENISKPTRHVLDRMLAGEIYSEFPSRATVLSFWKQITGSLTYKIPEP